MKTVNLYIAVSVRGPRKQDGRYGYVLEMPTIDPQKAVTLSNCKKLPEPSNDRTATLIALEESLKRIHEPCQLNIYTSEPFVAAALTKGWLEKWKWQDWKNKKGKLICDIAKWQSIEYLLMEHQYSIALNQPHSYQDWLVREVNKED